MNKILACIADSLDRLSNIDINESKSNLIYTSHLKISPKS